MTTTPDEPTVPPDQIDHPAAPNDPDPADAPTTPEPGPAGS